MKNLYVVIIGLFCGCFKDNLNDNDCLIMLVDLTDSHMIVGELSIVRISPLLRIYSDNLIGSTVTMVPITNLRFNKSYSTSIPAISKLYSNELERIRAIDSFTSHVKSNIAQIKQLPVGRKGSAIFENLFLQLNELAKCQCENKDLIILSDFREKSSLFNSYDSTQMNRVMRDSTYLTKLFNIQYPVVSLKGIRVIFINQPKDEESDRIFHIITSSLKIYLEAKDARVEIRTSL